MMAPTPELRFPEFREPWRPAHAGDAFTSSRARGEKGLPIYSVTLDRGLVRRDTLERHLAADAADGENLRARPGDLVYNTMRMWQGAVGLAEVECMVSPAYVVLSPKGDTSSEFFEQWFRHPRMRHLLGAYSHGLTRDRLRLYPDDFAQIPLVLPDQREQERIAEALGVVDRKIALLREKRDTLDRFKAGVMDRIFRREVRFRRDEGSEFPGWKKIPLKSAITLISGQHLAPDEYSSEIGQLPYFTGPSDYTNSTSQVTKWSTTGSAKTATAGDVVITVKGSGVGALLHLKLPQVRMGRQLMAIRTKEVPAELLFHCLGMDQWKHELRTRAAGNMIPGLSREDILSLEMVLPTDPEEQKRIAGFLSALGSIVEAHATQMASMETFRRGLIQRLFP